MRNKLILLKYAADADQDVPIPEYMSAGAAGLDLRANLKADLRDVGVLIPPNQVGLIGTGIILAIPNGIEGQIRPRSGLALKNTVTVLNSPGTIDSDFRGEIGVILINHGNRSFKIGHGDRIAQIVFNRVVRVVIETVDRLPPTKRGSGGFGSSGH